MDELICDAIDAVIFGAVTYVLVYAVVAFSKDEDEWWPNDALNLAQPPSGGFPEGL